jgi:hypothetical protein
MNLKPGQAYYQEFTTASPTTGAATNADSTPTATANRNGSDDGTFSLTVANLDAGRYSVTGTVPGGYAAGDIVVITAAATVGGVAGKAVIGQFEIDTKRVSDPLQLDLTEAVPTTNTAQTIGDALNAARAQGFGKWIFSGTTLTLYAPDNVTPVHTFQLNSTTAPTQRT